MGQNNILFPAFNMFCCNRYSSFSPMRRHHNMPCFLLPKLLFGMFFILPMLFKMFFFLGGPILWIFVLVHVFSGLSEHCGEAWKKFEKTFVQNNISEQPAQSQQENQNDGFVLGRSSSSAPEQEERHQEHERTRAASRNTATTINNRSNNVMTMETTDTQVTIMMDVPGVPMHQIKIQIENGNELTIAGKRTGIRANEFSHRIPLDESSVLINTMKANLSNGVLVVTAAKKKKPTPVSIKITATADKNHDDNSNKEESYLVEEEEGNDSSPPPTKSTKSPRIGKKKNNKKEQEANTVLLQDVTTNEDEDSVFVVDVPTTRFA